VELPSVTTVELLTQLTTIIAAYVNTNDISAVLCFITETYDIIYIMLTLMASNFMLRIIKVIIVLDLCVN
jgi:hypothetical protein